MLTPSDTTCSKCSQPGEFRVGHRQCRECERKACREAQQTPEARARQVAYREANRVRYRKMNVENIKRSKAERHVKIDKIKSRPCVDCGRSFPPYVMDFDHRDPDTKEHEINHLLNKTTAPWSRILAEIEKCDVVCVCCHRLRSWTPPKNRGSKARLMITLKGTTCVDCENTFHYCQLDFDHVRGEKLGCVPHMGSVKAIQAEAAKCDVVCANCHRARSHEKPKGTRRNNPSTLDMTWKRAGKGPQTTIAPRDEVVPYHLKLDAPAHRLWHDLAGNLTDAEVAHIGGVSKPMVCLYRKRMNIPSYRSQFKKVS